MMKKGTFMKKTLWLSMAVSCLLAGWSAGGRVKVDDFESYVPGQVDTVTTNWKVFIGNASGTSNIAVDPTDATNQVLDILEDSTSGGGYGILPASAYILNGETKTLFFRCRTTTGLPNSCIGMTDVDTPGNNSWAFISNLDRVIDNTSQAWGGAGPVWDPVPGAAMAGDTWFNIWIQTNHAANTYKIYMNSTPGANGNAATDRVGALANNPFRNSGIVALDRFMYLSYARSPAAHVLLDDIYVMDGATLLNPAMAIDAHRPTPANNATNVPLTATLLWFTGVDPNDPSIVNADITKHYVYFREGAPEDDPNMDTATLVEVEASGDPNDSCNPPIALARDKTYSWRVDESVLDSGTSDPNTIIGSVWTFDAEKSVPVITPTGQPVNVRVTTPATASFTTVFTCVSAPTVVWKKYVDGVNDITLVTGGDITITTTGPVVTTYTTTLQIANTDNTDQGRYYCLLTPGVPPVQSNYANLVTKKLLAHYEFEGGLTDSSTFDPHNGTGKSVVDPNNALAPGYDTGKVGAQAVVFTGAAIVDLGTGAYPKAGLGTGMDEGTISCWVKATQVGGLLSNYNNNILPNPGPPIQPAANTTGFSCALAGTSDGRVHLRGETAPGTVPIAESFMGAAQGAPVRTPPFNMINDGLWHHVAVTWQQGAQMIVYVDGVQVASSIALTPIYFANWQRGVVIGAIRRAIDRAELGDLYKGALDDLKVYNYAKDKYGIADIWYTETTVNVCIDTYESTYDYDVNCVVDLADFAALAAVWLDCGLYPNCPS